MFSASPGKRNLGYATLASRFPDSITTNTLIKDREGHPPLFISGLNLIDALRLHATHIHVYTFHTRTDSHS